MSDYKLYDPIKELKNWIKSERAELKATYTSDYKRGCSAELNCMVEALKMLSERKRCNPETGEWS